MDWLEVLFVLLFLGFSLLGRVAQRKPPPGSTLPAPRRSDLPAPEPGAPLPVPVDTSRATPGDLVPVRSGAGGWSAGWGEWPGIDEEEESADEEASAWSDDRNAEVIHEAEAVSLEPTDASEAAVRPLPAAGESLEVLNVDRAAEHERFHQKYFQPAAAAPRFDRLADHLRSRNEMRRAILLAEVLGPPRSMREGGEGR